MTKNQHFCAITPHFAKWRLKFRGSDALENLENLEDLEALENLEKLEALEEPALRGTEPRLSGRA